MHAVLSVNEGGWGRGRGESNGNAASGSRPRLSVPAHMARQHGMGVNTPHLHECFIYKACCTCESRSTAAVMIAAVSCYFSAVFGINNLGRKWSGHGFCFVCA